MGRSLQEMFVNSDIYETLIEACYFMEFRLTIMLDEVPSLTIGEMCDMLMEELLCSMRFRAWLLEYTGENSADI